MEQKYLLFFKFSTTFYPMLNLILSVYGKITEGDLSDKFHTSALGIIVE